MSERDLDAILEEWQNEEEWIGVDLDGTLAYYDEWRGMDHIGAPIPKMLNRVKRWLAEGKKVKILTARANTPEAIPYIEEWLVNVAGLPKLEVTNVKGHHMKELWDDRAVQVVPNTGETVIAESLLKTLEQDLPSHLSSKDEPDAFLLIRTINDEEKERP